MAVPRPKAQKRENLPAVAVGTPEKSGTTFSKLTNLQKQLILWEATGREPSKFARKYAKQIVPKHQGDEEYLLRKARARVRQWRRSEKYRQALYDWCVADVDLSMPDILKGVVGKAKAGRVDAARLALEITGRHAPNSEVQPAAIQVVFNNMPRPQAEPADVIEGEAEEIVEPDDEAL